MIAVEELRDRNPLKRGNYKIADTDEITTDLRNAVEGLQLELPYDRMGTVAVTGIRKLLATQVLMSLAGRGPAPF